MAASGMFPTPAYWGQQPPRGKRTRYVCANRTSGNGCNKYADMSETSIKANRIPRCDCGERLVPAPAPKRG